LVPTTSGFHPRRRDPWKRALAAGRALYSGTRREVFQDRSETIPAQRRRIQAVGFRQPANRLGEAAGLTRIDFDEGNAGSSS
jgi:hypothetical protein